tara:strand:+ start:531 stop:1307 length:777 start_codon:yes stop_codon:yes gene_type:complete
MVINKSYLKDSNLRILILSCNSYSDLWIPFVFCFKKYWFDCPWPVNIISDSSNIEELNGIKIKSFGSSLSWSEILKKALLSINEDYVIIMLDDFLLKTFVNNSEVIKIFSLVQNRNINMFRLIPRPAPLKIKNKLYGEISPMEKWRVSTQAAIWNKQILLKILNDNEHPWDFEMLGSKRASKIPSFFGSKNHIIKYYHHDVQRGLWFPWSIMWMRFNGVPFNKQSRETMSMRSTIYYVIVKFFIKIRDSIFPNKIKLR